MASAVVTRIRVPNFEGWKAHYDQGETMRRNASVRGVQVLRDASDPNLVTIVTRFDSVDDAKRMLASDEWKQAAGKGGPPLEISFVDVAEEKTY